MAGFTADPGSGVAADRRGTYAGFIDKIPYLVDLGITAVELLPGLRVRPARRARRARQLLGLPAGLVLRPAPGVCQPIRADRRGRRVPRPGQGAPSGRDRGHPRCRLQPHRGGRRGRTDLLVPWPRQRRLLPARRRRRLPRLQRLRQHPRYERAGGPQAHPRQPPLLGGGDARRRIQVRPRRRPVPRRGGRADGRPTVAVGHRDRPGPGRNQAHRGSLGRGRALPGRQLRRRSLVGVERPLPRRRARLRQGRPGHGQGVRPACRREPGPVRAQAARARREHQLRDLSRRLHAQRPGLL